MNNLKEWEENRKWLQDSEYQQELKDVVSELYALSSGIARLNTKGEFELHGIACLIDTVASKLDDMAHGRLKDMTLPK
jgi:hypothetical protein